MPRPALSLYRKRPLIRDHQALLVDASKLEDNFSQVARIRAATGIVVSSLQIEGLVTTKPALIYCQVADFWDKDISFFRSWLQSQSDFSLAGVVFGIAFGGEDELEYVAFLRRAVDVVRKKRLESIVEVGWLVESIISPVTTALAIRHSIDARADYVIIDASHEFSVEEMVQSAGGGELLLRVDEWDDEMPLYVRRMVAEGARGVVVGSKLLSADSATVNIGQLSEVVFGL